MIQDILQRLRDSLSLRDPEWDVAVGSPEYKILEAVAAELYAVEANSLLADYHFEVDTKIGLALDRFVAMWGVYRLAAKRATGTVTLSRGTAATVDIDIPSGVQVMKPATSISPQVVFMTTVAATLSAGQLSVEIPIESVVAGSVGNLVASEISMFIGSAVTGVTSVSNANPTSGGRDIEDDDSLRDRWRTTAFRNVSGTRDQFLALALDHEDVSRATVVGAQERYREQLEIIAGAATSEVPDAKYIYPVGGEFIGFDLGTEDEVIGVRNSDYTYNAADPPVITILDATDFPNGSIIDLEFDYTPDCSRNNPATGIVHKVDIFVAGTDAAEVTEEFTYQSGASFQFSTTGTAATNTMHRDNWRRTDETTKPTAGNIYVPLMRQPILTVPNSIVIGGNTYNKDTHYWLIRDYTTDRGSIRARDGLEWDAATDPANGSVVLMSYSYNDLVAEIDDAIQQYRLVGTDTLVHSAKKVYLRFHLSVVFGTAYTPASETTNIADALTDWLEGKGYRDNVQISDMIDVVKAVPSVDNVRLTTSAEAGSAYGIQRRAESGASLGFNTTDIYLNSDEIPVLESVIVTTRGVNTF